MRARNRLSAGFMRKPEPGKHLDGAGLWLVVRDDGGAQWVLRATIHGRRREMGLGGFPSLGLADARAAADRWRAVAAAGRGPIKEREAERRAASRADISLATITADCFEARKAELKGDGLAGRWLSPLALHVLPKLGKTPVTELDQRDIVAVIKPLWHEKADTGRKALNRLGIVLKHAAAMGLDVDLQATKKAKALLGRSRHIAKNIPAMAWADVPGFYASLYERLPSTLSATVRAPADARRYPKEATLGKAVSEERKIGKRDALRKHSRLELNWRLLEKHQNWDEAAMRARAEELFVIAREIWPPCPIQDDGQEPA